MLLEPLLAVRTGSSQCWNSQSLLREVSWWVISRSLLLWLLWSSLFMSVASTIEEDRSVTAVNSTIEERSDTSSRIRNSPLPLLLCRRSCCWWWPSLATQRTWRGGQSFQQRGWRACRATRRRASWRRCWQSSPAWQGRVFKPELVLKPKGLGIFKELFQNALTGLKPPVHTVKVSRIFFSHWSRRCNTNRVTVLEFVLNSVLQNTQVH